MTSILTATTKKLLTEDTGKILEMAVCLTYGISYDGTYKYGLEEPTALKPRLSTLPSLFPLCVHSAKRGARYDFTACTASRYLSVKSTKGNTMVAPQCVGQAQPTAFCERMGIPVMTVPILKAYIQENIKALLPVFLNYTISENCDILYYNKKTSAIKFIRLVTPINWTPYTFTWSCTADKWNNSAKLKVAPADGGKPINLLEVQFHTKSRTNMAVRWCFEALLALVPTAFSITTL